LICDSVCLSGKRFNSTASIDNVSVAAVTAAISAVARRRRSSPLSPGFDVNSRGNILNGEPPSIRCLMGKRNYELDIRVQLILILDCHFGNISTRHVTS
jgi:hypothetical protein